MFGFARGFFIYLFRGKVHKSSVFLDIWSGMGSERRRWMVGWVVEAL